MTHSGYHRPTSIPFGPGFALLLTLILVPVQAIADRIHFSDGESITGTLKSIGEGKVVWQNAILGELTIEQHHIDMVETDGRFDLKITGTELENCWMYQQRNKQHLHCDQGVQTLSDWKLVIAAGETLTEPPPLLTQRGSVIFAAEDSSGNNDITKFNVDARSELRYIESRHTLALRYQEESADSQTTRNMWRTSYQYDQFFETTYIDLLGKGTLNYVDERFSNGRQNTTPAFLWNLDFAWRFNEQGMEMFHRHAVLQAFDSGDDWEVSTSTGFKYPINGRFSSVIQLEYDYDNLPAEAAVDKRDQKWSIGLNYDW